MKASSCSVKSFIDVSSHFLFLNDIGSFPLLLVSIFPLKYSFKIVGERKMKRDARIYFLFMVHKSFGNEINRECAEPVRHKMKNRCDSSARWKTARKTTGLRNKIRYENTSLSCAYSVDEHELRLWDGIGCVFAVERGMAGINEHYQALLSTCKHLKGIFRVLKRPFHHKKM